jgi:hypothetical protein
MSLVIQKYVESLIDKEIGMIVPYAVAPAVPFIMRPDPFDFDTRRRTSFPLPSDFKNITGPELQDLPLTEESGDDQPPRIEYEDIFGNLEDYIRDEERESEKGLKGTIMSEIERRMDFEYGIELASGQKAAVGTGDGIFTMLAGLSGAGAMAGSASRQSKEQLELIAAKSALGYPGYGIGRVNNQLVGKGIDYFGYDSPKSLTGNLPSGITTQQQQEIVDNLEGKRGGLGTAYDEYVKSGGRFDMSKPQTEAMLGYEKTIIESTIPNDLKASLLGYNRASKLNTLLGFGGSPVDKNYYSITPFEQILQDREETEQNRTGNVPSGRLTDVSTVGGFIPVQGPVLPPIEITGEGVESESYSDLGGGYSESLEGNYTAYGGRIGMSNGGFTSKTETIKGVGLIKPEQTFMDTDVVDDRFEFDAEQGDYIVNGPASSMKKNDINLLVNYAIDELKKEGVDIRVGNPKIKEKDKVPLITASSETYIPKVIAEKIGYPILEAINDMGKPEVERLKNKLDDRPTDKSKYEASSGGFLFDDKRRGTMLFNQPVMDVTNPNIDRAYDAFVPGISDVPIPMKPDDEMFFGYTLGSIKDALYQKEMKGYEGKGYIFTGVKPKGKKASSAFGKFQITYSTLEDFKDRSDDYANLSKEEKIYVDNLIQQGRDKVNLDLQYGLYRKGKIIPMKSVSKKLRQQLSGLQQGTIPQEIHKKHYDKIADLVIRQKLKDHKNKGLNKFLASYGEGQQYADDVEKILKKLGKKNLIKN